MSSEGPARVLVLVGGGRAWPNFWSVLAYKPSQVYLFIPESERSGIEPTLSWLTARGIRIGTPSILPPYDAGTARDAAVAVLRAHPLDEIFFNVTGGPKPIAMGVCRAVWEAERCNTYAAYIDTRKGQIHSLLTAVPPSCVTFDPTLADYLAACGRRPSYPDEMGGLPAAERELARLTRTLITADYRELIIPLRNLRNQKAAAEGRRKRDGAAVPFGGTVSSTLSVTLEEVSPAQLDHLELIAASGLLTFAHNGAGVEIRFHSQKAARFLEGTWLELYAREAAMECVAPDGGPMFVDSRCSVNIESAEIDLACLDRNGILLYGSCKTEQNPFKPKHGRLGVEDPARGLDTLNEIVKNAAILGGEFCGRILITNAPRELCREQLRMQARERAIGIVCLEDLPNLGSHLAAALADLRKGAR